MLAPEHSSHSDCVGLPGLAHIGRYAKSVGARGTGMWTASAIDYAGDPEMGQTFWKDLKNFANHELISQYDSNGPPPSIVAEPPCTIADPVGSAVAGALQLFSSLIFSYRSAQNEFCLATVSRYLSCHLQLHARAGL